MKTTFRIAKNDTIIATMVNSEGQLLSSVYDSQFTTINEVISRLISKVPYTHTKKVVISITNEDKQTYKLIERKVNK